MTFDEIMKQALNETIDERLNQMLAITPKPKFSLSYRIWEYKTLKDFRKNQCDDGWTLRKARRIVTTVMLAATILFVITACAVVGMTTGRFSFKNQRDYSELFMAALSSDKICIGECYGLPEEGGWVIDYFYVDNYGTLIRYSREEKIVSIQPYYEKAATVESSLYINGTTATCRSLVQGEPDVTKIVAVQTLEKQGFLWIWSKYDNTTWTKTVNTNVIAMSNTKTGLSSGKYRLKTVFTLTDKNGKTETITVYSDVKLM